MIKIRYKRILFFQAIYLIALGIITFVLFNNNIGPFKFLLVWTLAIIFNLIYIKRSALPTRSLLNKIRPSGIEEEFSWAEIEESIAKNTELEKKLAST